MSCGFKSAGATGKSFCGKATDCFSHLHAVSITSSCWIDDHPQTIAELSVPLLTMVDPKGDAHSRGF
tara:strand:- start:2385 stop:2585 length:201 start_codon:yes stop_codon:yes gene_type:complete